MQLRRRILNGSKTFLEKQFLKELESVIEKNPREAQLGGIPTITNKIRAYIRLRATRKDLANENEELTTAGDDYPWILTFFLLRCGFVKEAYEYVTQEAGFRSADRSFVQAITNYAQSPDRRLTPQNQQRINGEYQQRTRNAPENTVDPYRIACYKIVGRCDLSRRNLDGIKDGVEDWIWLQFALAREVERAEEAAGEFFGLDEISKTIKNIGEKHFAKEGGGAGGYGTYFLLQILGGMFEESVFWLLRHSPVSAVHFAIALNFYGLLRVSDLSVAGEQIRKSPVFMMSIVPLKLANAVL